MSSRFFIDRPIFASVLSIVITLAGGIAVFNLPLAQYPPVAPPQVMVNCSYPGASAQVVAETVAAPIEQKVNGVEGMMYMSSNCANDGSYGLTVTFQQGMNLNLAQVLVQNRVNLALPQLPDVLKQTGVTTRKMSPDILMSVNLISPGGRYDQLYLSNYAWMRCRDELLRLEGISDVFISGQHDYSMRLWLDPEKLASRNLGAGDVVAAVREQNQQVACGRIGQQPVAPGQETEITLTTLGRLTTPEQFGDIILRSPPSGRVTRLRDVARIELGAKNDDVTARLDGLPSVGLIIFQLPDANALEMADRIHAKMEELAKDFPDDMEYHIEYDTTPYTRECIQEVFKSLGTAIVLVALVVLVFLQNWRSAVIPLIAVPVAIIGTFGVMAVMHFSLNNLTLFGLVLAIGIVVDNAIVVVEAVEHHIENGLDPREATIKAMSQLSAPVIAVGLVLSAVFVPCAFISGITGQFFRQFALTIASSTIISTFNSLTLSPALTAVLLRRRDQETHEALPRLVYPLAGGWIGYAWLTPPLASWLERLAILLPARLAIPLAPAAWWTAAALMIGGSAAAGWLLAGPANAVLRRAFAAFNAGVQRSTTAYTRAVSGLIRVSAVVLVVYAVLLAVTYWDFRITPKGFIPPQDMGYLMVSVQLPDAASCERTRRVTEQVQRICLSTPGVKHTVAVAGMSFAIQVNASNFGSMFVILDDFDKRRTPELSADRILASLKARLAAGVPGAQISVFPSAPIRGVGRTGGFKVMVEDRGDFGPRRLQRQGDRLVELARKEKNPYLPPPTPALNMQPNVFRADAPQLFADVNRSQCMALGVPKGDVDQTLQTYLGSLYINDFNLFGRTWEVVAQADDRFRNQVDALRMLKVRNNVGAMVPLGTLTDVREANGPLILTRYNTYLASAVNGSTGPLMSSRQGIDMMQGLADRELPSAMVCEWTEMAYLELQAGNTAMYIFALAVIAVFLVLAAQYESWSLPLAIILVVPMCLFSAVLGVTAVPAAFKLLQECLHKMHIAVFIPGAGAQSDINIFTQIGFVVLVGLASKNAILIVEFAKRVRDGGASRREAALAACKLRLRPIVMTSFAFILGVFPLLIGRGAGSEMRRTLGTAVFSGMLGVTLFGIFLTPVFFCVIDWLGGRRLFHARTMEIAGRVCLVVLTLGLVLLVDWTIRSLRHNGQPLIPPEDS
jgi:multidrug efflux pump